MHTLKYRLSFFTLLALVLVGCSKPDLTDSSGQGVSLKDANGRWMAMNVWAEWCDPCREEIPELNALEKKGDIRVVGYDFDGSKGDSLKKKIDSLSINFPVVTNSPLDLLGVKAPQVLPATLIINPEGKLVDTLYGPQTQASIQKKVRQLQQKGSANG